jgi:nitric oxide reductase large subunit
MNSAYSVGIAWIFIGLLSFSIFLAPIFGVLFSRRVNLAAKLRWIIFEIVVFFTFGLIAFSLESNQGVTHAYNSNAFLIGYISSCIVFVAFLVRNQKNKKVVPNET